MNLKFLKNNKIYFICFIFCFLIFILSDICLASEANKTNTFMVSAVLEDGSIFPIGFCDRGNWSNRWDPPPKNKEEYEEGRIDITLNTIPEPWYSPLSSFPKDWNYQLKNGKTGILKVGAMVMNSDMTIDWGHWCLSSNLKQKTWGVAVGGDGTPGLEPIIDAIVTFPQFLIQV